MAPSSREVRQSKQYVVVADVAVVVVLVVTIAINVIVVVIEGGLQQHLP